MLIACLPLAFSCGGKKSNAPGNEVSQVNYFELTIGGMTCTGCEQTIQNNVSKLEGITSVKASHTAGTALVGYVEGKADTMKIKEVISESGYTVKRIAPGKAEATE